MTGSRPIRDSEVSMCDGVDTDVQLSGVKETWTDGQIDGWIDRWINGQIDNPIERLATSNFANPQKPEYPQR